MRDNQTKVNKGIKIKTEYIHNCNFIQHASVVLIIILFFIKKKKGGEQ